MSAITTTLCKRKTEIAAQDMIKNMTKKQVQVIKSQVTGTWEVQGSAGTCLKAAEVAG